MRMTYVRPLCLQATGLTITSPTHRFSILACQQGSGTYSHQNFSQPSSSTRSSSSSLTASRFHKTSSIRSQNTPSLVNSPSQQSLYFSSFPVSLSADGGHSSEDSFDPPGGWLFGVPPGEKYQKEGWERVWTWGMGTCVVVAVVGWAYKPDTRYVALERMSSILQDR